MTLVTCTWPGDEALSPRPQRKCVWGGCGVTGFTKVNTPPFLSFALTSDAWGLGSFGPTYSLFWAGWSHRHWAADEGQMCIRQRASRWPREMSHIKHAAAGSDSLLEKPRHCWNKFCQRGPLHPKHLTQLPGHGRTRVSNQAVRMDVQPLLKTTWFFIQQTSQRKKDGQRMGKMKESRKDMRSEKRRRDVGGGKGPHAAPGAGGTRRRDTHARVYP